jgi:flagellar biosynthesis/type III secretory pathway protein FliH
MNLPSEAQRNIPSGAHHPVVLAALPLPNSPVAENIVELLEFRSLTWDEARPWRGTEAAGCGAMEFGGIGPSGLGDSSAADAAARDAVKAARDEGFQAGEREGQSKARLGIEAEMRAGVERNRARLVSAMEDFGEARARYFASVEQEVVKLALAIAARVLHREAQVDGLLLAGAVRVALDKMAERSGVVLRAAVADVKEWEQMFQATQPTERPRIVGDVKLERGDCVLETKMGTVELGVNAQLEEIEKGFFDLLNHRPVR